MPLDVTFQPRYESPASEPGRVAEERLEIFPNHKSLEETEQVQWQS